jgi:hypothetical protein
MLRARLLRKPTKCHKKYLRGRKQFPLKLNTQGGPMMQVDTLFQDLKAQSNLLPPNVPPPRLQWMSDATIRLIDSRASLRRDPHHSWQRTRALTRQIKASLKLDRAKRVEDAAAAIAACMTPDNPDIQGAYTVLKRWYRHAAARPPKPSRENLNRVSANFHALYTCELPSPPGAPLVPQVGPFPIKDDLPSVNEVREAIKRMRRNKAPGHSRMQAKDFKAWEPEAFPDDPEQIPSRER